MKYLKLLFALLAAIVSVAMNAQVGIGTTTPTAKLEIDASADAIPALEIVPQATTPTGTSDGQICILENSLYVYDSSRSKWLSSETMVLSWGGSGNFDDRYLETNGNFSATGGIKIPKNATIVAITAQATTGGNPTKGFEIRKNNPSVTVNTFSLVANTYNNKTSNIDINADDFLRVFATNAGSDVTSPTVTLWIKWRK